MIINVVLRRLLRRRNPLGVLARQQLGQTLIVTARNLLAIFVLHTGAMMFFEGLSVGDGLWLTLTTATTVGYGDLSASTLGGRLATVVLLYACGIFVLAKLMGDYFDYRGERRLRMQRGEWEWDMRDHIVVINVPDEDPLRYFSTLIGQFRASQRFRDTPVLILSRDFADGLPAALLDLGNVAHFSGSGEDDRALRASHVETARAVVVLSRSDHDPACDSVTFDILHRLRALQVSGQVLAECVREDNRQRFEAAGAHIVIRPVRAYPGMVVRGLVAPGAQKLMEELFSSAGGEYRRLDVPVEGRRWADVVSTLLGRDLGVAVAFEDPHGALHVTPRAAESIHARALFVVIDAADETPPERLRGAVEALRG